MTTTAAAPAVAGTADPIDSLDFTDLGADVSAPVDGAIPEHMMLGGPPNPAPDPATETDTTKAPAVGAPSASQAAPATEVKLPDGYTKDALGRVHGPDGRVLKKEEAAKLLADATASQQQVAGSQQQAHTGQPGKAEPFRYRFNGTNHEAEGFEYDPATGSVTVKPEHVGVLRDAMNARHVITEGRDINAKLRGEVETLRGEIEQRSKLGTETEVQSRALIEHYSKILAEPDEEKAIVQFFQLRSNYPVLLEKARASYWERAAKAGAPRPESQQRPSATDTPKAALPPREIAAQQTSEYVEQVKLDHAFRDLTPEHWKQLSARFERTPYAYLRPATTEEATEFGVTEGQIVFDTDAFRADVDEFAAQQRSARATAEQQAKLREENAVRTQPSIAAPPTPGGGGAPTKTGPKPITNKKELDDWWESPDL